MQKVLVKLVLNVPDDMDAERIKKIVSERLCTEDILVLLAEVGKWQG